MGTYHFSIAITGANGSAASVSPAADTDNRSKRPLSGEVKAIYVKYNTQPTTTDIVVKTAGLNSPSLTLLTLTNKNTDGWFFPLIAAHDTSGVAATYDGTHGILIEPPIDDYIDVTIAQGNAGTIDVYLMTECD